MKWFEYVLSNGQVWPRITTHTYLKGPANRPIFSRELVGEELDMDLQQLVARYPPPEVTV